MLECPFVGVRLAHLRDAVLDVDEVRAREHIRILEAAVPGEDLPRDLLCRVQPDQGACALAFLGLRPFASLLDGAIASAFGVRAAGVVLSLPALVAALLLTRLAPRPGAD